MQTILKTTAGDHDYDFSFTLKDSDGNVIDITSAVINVRGQLQTGTALTFTGSAVVVSGSAGTCKYTVADGDFDTPGQYYVELEVELQSGAVITFNDLVVVANPQLPRSI